LPTGCYTTLSESISSTPAPIGGTAAACIGTNTNLSDVTAFGAWSSSNNSIANVGSGTGIVTGMAAGTATITYELSALCLITRDVTVNPSPAAIAAGTGNVCVGSAITLTDATTGGTWNSSVPVIATIDPLTGVVTGRIASAVDITYTLPTGCKAATTLTVNPLATISGPANLCLGGASVLTGSITGGTWASSNTSIATIDVSTGIATGMSLGNAVISYTLPTGCLTTNTFTVSPPPYPISGTTHVCEGATTPLTATGGGGWYSSNTSVAAVGFGSGVVTGITAGTSIITYTMGTSCVSTAVVTVNPMPAAIGGPANVCRGAAITLSDAITGGSWSGSSSLVSVDTTTGSVSGLSAGGTTVTYTLPAGCYVTAPVTVNPITSIYGPSQVCVNATVTLLDTTGVGTGTWSTTGTSIATIDPTSGMVSGVSAGIATFTYSLPTTCFATTPVTVNPLPVIYTVTGGGSYCSGLGGMDVQLDGSVAGFNYQLYNGSTGVGTPMPGTGGLLDYGFMTAAGTYTVLATDTLTGCVNAMASSAPIIVIPSYVPSVTVTASTPTSICAGTFSTFSATASYGGSAPAFDWKVNGTSVGTSGASYGYTPSNGDVITVTLHTSAACTFPLTVSDTVTMTVNPFLLPAVTIASSLDSTRAEDTLCAGIPVSFNASVVNGGASPVVMWFKNGTHVATGSTYSLTPADGDVIYTKLHSNYPCTLADSVSSNYIAMRVYPEYIPVVTIDVTPGVNVAKGQADTFTAVATGAGPAPTYVWMVNHAVVPGATSSVFVRNNLNNKDSVTCVVKGTGLCGRVSFNSVEMNVSTTGIQQLSGVLDNIKLLPNPNSGSFHITGNLNGANKQQLAVEITNMLGQAVYNGKLNVQGGKLDEQISLDNSLANGMYMLKLSASDENKSFRFVIGR
jgi:uncharacterized protein YjdB